MSFQMIVKPIFIILVGFFYTLSAKSSHCDLIFKSTEVISLDQSKFLAEVYTSPVRDQCFARSCSFQSSMGLHENLSRTNFDIDYNIISSMLDRADRLKKREEEGVKIESSSYFDLMPGQAVSDAYIEIQNHGVLPKGEFSLSNSTKELVQSEVTRLRKKNLFETNEEFNTVDAINVVLGYHLPRRWKSRQFKKLLRSLKKDVGQFREAARLKHRELFGSISEITNYFSDIIPPPTTKIESLSSVKVKNINSNFDQIVEVVISNLKKGRSVVMTYAFVSELIKSNGESRRDIDLSTLIDRIDDPDHPWSGLPHASLIENYRYDESGRLVFLVKDSYGINVYDNGYIHLGEDYLRGALRAISILELE